MSASERVGAADKSDALLRQTLAAVAPGTAMRDALERILRGRTGALVVLGFDKAVEVLCTGGFALDVPFSATGLRELAKMDGAVVLDRDATRILRCNVQLVPDPTIPTEESGTRHRTAERVAKQTGYPVISVSQSMHIIALYIGGRRYVLEDSATILSKANQALATLERYKQRLDEVSGTLSALEIEDLVTVRDVAAVAQRLEMVRRIAGEIDGYVIELGTDGRLLSLQLDELIAGVDADRELVARDYLPGASGRRQRTVSDVLSELDGLSSVDLLDLGCGRTRDGAQQLGRGARQRRGASRLSAARARAPAARSCRRPPGRPLRHAAEAARGRHRRPAGRRGRRREPGAYRPRGPVPPGRVVDPRALRLTGRSSWAAGVGSLSEGARG